MTTADGSDRNLGPTSNRIATSSAPPSPTGEPDAVRGQDLRERLRLILRSYSIDPDIIVHGGLPPAKPTLQGALIAAVEPLILQARADAEKIIRYGHHLVEHGERAPGGDETWAEFHRMAETWLRARLP